VRCSAASRAVTHFESEQTRRNPQTVRTPQQEAVVPRTTDDGLRIIYFTPTHENLFVSSATMLEERPWPSLAATTGRAM
jgi:hypothetical protein